MSILYIFARNRVVRTIRCAVFFLLLNSIAMAAPYFGDSFEYQQPDGETFTVRIYGDEFFAYQETEDGYLIIRDPDTGCFCYAEVIENGTEMVSTGVRVGQDKPPKLKPKQRLNRQAVRDISKARRDKFGVDERGLLKPELYQRLFPGKGRKEGGATVTTEGSPTPYSATTDATSVQNAPTTEGAIAGSPLDPYPPVPITTGERVGLLMLVSFPDRPEDVKKTIAEVEAFCNDEHYTDDLSPTSVYGYFKIQSNGKLSFKNIVTAWFTAAHERDYYSDPSIEFGVRAQELVNEGLAILDAQGFDFTECDANGDGVIDGVNLCYAGTRPSGMNGLYPHHTSSSWTGFPAQGLSDIFQYQITDLPNSLHIGTFTHECGHMICGFPDLYSYDGNAAFVGTYSHMSFALLKHPAHIDPYLKIRAGWADVVDLDSSSHERCAVQEDQNFFYRYKNPTNPEEYFLFEVRGPSGYEGSYGGATSYVNPTKGLVVYHALETGSNIGSSIFTADNPNTDYSTPYELLVMEAHPATSTVPWYDDPNPGNNDSLVSGDVSELMGGNSTTPALNFWAADGRTIDSGLHIHSVSAYDSTMTFIAGTGALAGPASTEVTAITLGGSLNEGSALDAQTFAVFNGGSGSLNYTISDDADWLDCTPVTGTVSIAADPITVNYITTNLASGTHTATITVDGGTAGSQTIAVSVTVWDSPTLVVNPTSLSATGIESLSGFSASFEITNGGGGSCAYSLASADSWISLSRGEGTIESETDVITIQLDATSLAGGTHNGSITLSSPTATNSPITIPVSFEVQSAELAVTYPNGGETIRHVEDVMLTWLSTIGGHVKIELLKNNALETVIVESTENDGGYLWNVPATLDVGTDYSLRITQVENGSYVDTSDAFFSVDLEKTCDDFESGMDGWQQDSSDDIDWTRTSQTAVTNSTGPSSAIDGYYYLYIEATGNTNMTAILYKDFDLSKRIAPRLTFNYHMYGAWMGTLYLEVSTDGGNAWASPPAWSLSNDQGDAWKSTEVDLSAYAGNSSVRLRFRGVIGSGDASDMAIDNVCLSEGPIDGFRFANDVLYAEEKDGSITVAIERTGDLSGVASVEIATSNGTADSSDYTSNSATLSWNAAEGGVRTFTVAITDDGISESDETVLLTLSNPSGDTILDPNPIALWIIDGNDLPTVDAGSDQAVALNYPQATSGADILLDAAADDETDSTWEDSLGTWDVSIDSGVSYVADVGSSLHGITAAYRFPGGTSGNGGCDGLGLEDLGVDKQPITIEIWFKPAASASYTSNGQILWETGGNAGMGIFYNDGFVETAHDGNEGQMGWDVSTLTNEFIQVVVTYDPNSTSNNYHLYINGELKVSSDRSDNDTSGGDDAGLGNRGQSNTGGAGNGDSNTESFEGDIAIFRAYHNQILNSDEVRANYASIAGSGSALLDGTVIDVDGDALTTIWAVTDGPGSVSFDDESAVDTTANFFTPGVYILRLTADDGTGEAFDEVTIRVALIFSDWINNYAVGGQTAAGDDPDGDGVPNFFEYLYGSDPTDADSKGFRVIAGLTPAGNRFLLKWQVAEVFAFGTTYGVEVSTNLQAWSSLPTNYYELVETATNGMNDVQLTIIHDVGPAVFFRMTN